MFKVDDLPNSFDLSNFPHMAWVNPWHMVFRHLPKVPHYSVVVSERSGENEAS